MFQFTTTTVINSDKDLTTGKTLFGGIAANTTATPPVPANFYVLRVGNFTPANVVECYEAAGYAAEMAKATFDLSTALTGAVDGDQFRIVISLGLTQGSALSYYANDLGYKGKNISVDFIFDTDAATTLDKLVKTINKYELMIYGTKLVDVTGATTFLTIESKDEYQKFISISIDKFSQNANQALAEYIPVKTLADLPVAATNAAVTNAAEGYFAGKESFGSYTFLLHNLRLPTYERTGFASPNQDESPIPGALYTQFTIHYCKDRGILGDNAVGDFVKSQTTHVFYVHSNYAAAFKTALQTAGITVTTL